MEEESEGAAVARPGYFCRLVGVAFVTVGSVRSVAGSGCFVFWLSFGMGCRGDGLFLLVICVISSFGRKNQGALVARGTQDTRRSPST